VATQPQPNAGNATGAFYSTVSLKNVNQSRDSATDAYYRPIVGKRKNFHLLTGHSVVKINFSHRTAASVNVSLTFISRWLCQACREIILAAGTPRTPQILQLSGIGPRKLLSGLAIDVLEELPGVGSNFQDQPAMYPQYTCTPPRSKSESV
jgi:choline dehydrogenase-like flavoprotein